MILLMLAHWSVLPEWRLECERCCCRLLRLGLPCKPKSVRAVGEQTALLALFATTAAPAACSLHCRAIVQLCCSETCSGSPVNAYMQGKTCGKRTPESKVQITKRQCKESGVAMVAVACRAVMAVRNVFAWRGTARMWQPLPGRTNAFRHRLDQ